MLNKFLVLTKMTLLREVHLGNLIPSESDSLGEPILKEVPLGALIDGAESSPLLAEVKVGDLMQATVGAPAETQETVGWNTDHVTKSWFHEGYDTDSQASDLSDLSADYETVLAEERQLYELLSDLANNQ
jgi:hypothetical protein